MQQLINMRAAALAATMLMTVLAGCSSPDKQGADNPEHKDPVSGSHVNKEGFPIVNEPLSLTMMGPDVGIQNWQDMVVFQEMEKLTGIKLQFRNAPLDSFDTKKNLVFASGDLPDIFYAAQITSAEEVNYGGQGLLVPLEELIDQYAPNIKKVLDKHPDIRKSITTPDGHIYSLPRIDLSAVWYRGPMWYNGKFLKALNMDKLPETTEELYTYLKRVKEEDPNGNGKQDEIPLVSVKLDDIRMFMLGFWGIYGEVIYADKDGKVHYTPMEEGYKGYLTFLNRLWNEGLLDKETFSQTDDQKKAKGKNNQVALFSDYHPYFTLGGEPGTDDPMMLPVKSDMVDAPVYGKHPGLSTGAFAITSSNPSPEATMRWIDYLYTYEGATLFGQGPEGILWKYKDKEKQIKEWLPVPGGGDREDYRATLTPDYGIVTPGVADAKVSQGLRGEFDDWLDKETLEKLVPYAKVPYPKVYQTQEEQQETSRLRSDLDTYVKQMEAKFVTGQEPLSNWDKYSDQLKKMGADRVVEIYQAAYDRWDSK
ncbi:Lipoprotein lplA [Chlamydia abortus]|uniref:Extracellular solute-binding protein n=1 Tax=Paenibacillus residui TaxID=629724 RepID=A0ABW3DAE2_9BACL|nr:extracellular solute-binding protein [Paenibacillus sp. 32O-W]SHE13235.1 Lipoprotein lplA [Chlamydia abortus]